MVTNPETPSLRSELRSFGEEIFLADASRCCRLANQDTELTRKHTTVYLTQPIARNRTSTDKKK